MEKRADYQQFKTGNFKELLEEGILIKDAAGGVVRGIGGEDHSKLLGQLFTASPNSTQGKAAEVLAWARGEAAPTEPVTFSEEEDGPLDIEDASDLFDN